MSTFNIHSPPKTSTVACLLKFPKFSITVTIPDAFCCTNKLGVMRSSHFPLIPIKWTVLSITFMVLGNTARGQELSPEYAAALCVAKNKNCPPETANQSVSCKPNTYVKAQNHSCLMAACIFCRRPSNHALGVCSSSWAIAKWCPEISLPPISPSPSLSTVPSISTSFSAIPASSSYVSSPTVEPSLPDSSPRSLLLSPSGEIVSSSPTETAEWSPSFSPMETPTLSSSPSHTYSSDLAAAMCIANAQTCDSKTSEQTKFCQPHTFVKEQHTNCLKAACLFCRRDLNVGVGVCKAWSIKHWCPKVTLESMTPSSSPSVSPSLMSASPLTTNPPSSTPTSTVSSKLIEFKGPDHAAAECFALAKKCTLETANESGVCEPNQFPKKQTDLCLKKACHFCSRPENQNIDACNSWAIKHWCISTKSETPGPTTNPKASKSLPPYPSCAYQEENGQVAIPMSNMKPQGQWSKTGDGKAIVWRSGNNRTSVDSWQSTASSEYCFNVLINKAGTYYITAHTAAPHWSEHNDMWLRCSAKIDLYDAKTHKKKVTNMAKDRFFKAYQNFGGNRIADIISSVNHDPHIFVTLPVKSNTIIQLCIAGRSSKFKVYDLVMIHCVGEECKRSSQHIREAKKSLKYTTCRSDYM